MLSTGPSFEASVLDDFMLSNNRPFVTDRLFSTLVLVIMKLFHWLDFSNAWVGESSGLVLFNWSLSEVWSYLISTLSAQSVCTQVFFFSFFVLFLKSRLLSLCALKANIMPFMVWVCKYAHMDLCVCLHPCIASLTAPSTSPLPCFIFHREGELLRASYSEVWEESCLHCCRRWSGRGARLQKGERFLETVIWWGRKSPEREERINNVGTWWTTFVKLVSSFVNANGAQNIPAISL